MAADTEKDNPGQRNEDFGAIDVTTLKEQVRLEAPRGTVTVRGIVERLQRGPSISQRPFMAICGTSVSNH